MRLTLAILLLCLAAGCSTVTPPAPPVPLTPVASPVVTQTNSLPKSTFQPPLPTPVARSAAPPKALVLIQPNPITNLVVSWPAQPGAASYTVYERGDFLHTTGWNAIETTNGTQYDLPSFNLPSDYYTVNANPGAATVTLAWNPVPLVAGYVLSEGTESDYYTNEITVNGSATDTVVVSNIELGEVYYFVVASFDSNNVQSVPSGEISWQSPSKPWGVAATISAIK